jgi:glucose-6-phosphate 1-epimerase
MELHYNPPLSHSLWPHAFHASLHATFGTDLTLTLGLKHLGSLPAQYEMAIHPYIAVGDVTRVRISGLEAARFEDHSPAPSHDAALTLGKQGIDRLYECAKPVIIHDDANKRNIVVHSPEAGNRILWNPGEKGVPGLGQHVWRQFLCLEPGNIGSQAPILQPGQQATFTTSIQVRDQ